MPRPQRKAPPYDEKKVLLLLARQQGVVARGQLAELGVTPADIRRFVRRRLLFALGGGVYAETPKPDLLQRAWHMCLHYGRAGVADRTALELARDAGGKHLTLPVEVAVAAGRNVDALPGVVVHHVSRLDRIVALNASPPRMHPAHATLRHAARAPSDDDLVARLADTVSWRLAKPKRLLNALDELPRLARRRFIREVLLDLADGACSVLEREYLVRVERAHGLPGGSRQAPRQTAEGVQFRDVLYELFRLVVELDGRLFHSGKKGWDADHERDLDDLLDGKASVRLGWSQVFDTPCRTAGKVATLLQQRGWDGEATACGPDCALGG